MRAPTGLTKLPKTYFFLFFAHDLKLEVWKYLPSFPFWECCTCKNSL